MWSEDRVLSTLREAVAETGADAAEASLYLADRNISRFAGSSLRQNMSELTGSITVRAWAGRRSGVSTTSSLDSEGIRRASRQALAIALQSEEVEGFQGIFSGDHQPSSVHAFDDTLAAMKPIEKAAALGGIFRSAAGRQTLFAGTYTTINGQLAVLNSRGVERVAPFTTADALFIALHRSQSGFATQISRRLEGFDVSALAAEAEEKARMFAGDVRELPPGEYDVILEPAALAEIFEWLSMIAFNGRSWEDGSSFLLDRLEQRLVDSAVTIADDAIDPAFMPFPFDLEGQSKRRIEIIDRGVVRTPLVDTLFARRFGLTPTASCSDLSSDDHGMALHLSMAGGDSTREELISSSKRAIWVTRFHYINGLLEPKSALMTGTTRDGTFLVEDGKVVARLANLRWTQSIVEAFRNIAGLTAERRAIGTWWNPIGGTITPTVRIRGWNFTGAAGGGMPPN